MRIQHYFCTPWKSIRITLLTSYSCIMLPVRGLATSVNKSAPLPSATIAVSTRGSELPKHMGRSKRDEVTPKIDLRSLDGLRTFSCLAVMAFHAMLYWGTQLTWYHGNQVLNSTPLRAIVYTPIGVDFFLVLTGLWAAYHLIPAMERAALDGKPPNTAWTAVVHYYKRRCTTVLLPYATTLLLVYLTIDHSTNIGEHLIRNRNTVFEYCSVSWPLNLVFLNNWIGFGGCGTVFWSLAVQIQFYILFPIVLVALKPAVPGFRNRVAALAVVLCLVNGPLRLLMAQRAGTQMPLPAYAHPQMPKYMAELSVKYYDYLYFNTLARLGNLATGVLLGVVLAAPKAVKVLLQKKAIVSVANWVMCLVFAHYVLTEKLTSEEIYDGDSYLIWPKSKEFAAWAYHGSPLYSTTVGLVILSIILHADPVSTIAAKILTTFPVRMFSAISYHAYLLHMVAFYWLEDNVLPRDTFTKLTQRDALAGFVGIYICMFVVTIGAAVKHYAFHQILIKLGRKLRIIYPYESSNKADYKVE